MTTRTRNGLSSPPRILEWPPSGVGNGVDPVEESQGRASRAAHAQLGWELWNDSGDLLMTQLCRSDREIQEVSAAWREAMIEKGWR